MFQMSRARTPFGAVPISTIYGFDYPLSNGIEKEASTKHEKLSDCVDYMVRSTRAFSENRLVDPYYSSPACSSLSFMPMALRSSRGTTPVATSIRAPAREMPQRTTTMSFTSTTPWDKTGFYYSPRYPQSHKGTASTYSTFSRRYYDDDLDIHFTPYGRIQYDYFR